MSVSRVLLLVVVCGLIAANAEETKVSGSFLKWLEARDPETVQAASFEEVDTETVSLERISLRNCRCFHPMDESEICYQSYAEAVMACSKTGDALAERAAVGLCDITEEWFYPDAITYDKTTATKVGKFTVTCDLSKGSEKCGGPLCKGLRITGSGDILRFADVAYTSRPTMPPMDVPCPNKPPNSLRSGHGAQWHRLTASLTEANVATVATAAIKPQLSDYRAEPDEEPPLKTHPSKADSTEQQAVKPQADRGSYEPHAPKGYADKPHTSKGYADKPYASKGYSDKPHSSKGYSDEPHSKGYSDKGYAEESHPSKGYSDESQSSQWYADEPQSTGYADEGYEAESKPSKAYHSMQKFWVAKSNIYVGEFWLTSRYHKVPYKNGHFQLVSPSGEIPQPTDTAPEDAFIVQPNVMTLDFYKGEGYSY